jgi:hypothetical protein
VFDEFGFSLRTSRNVFACFAVKVSFFTQTQKLLTAKVAKRSRKERKVLSHSEKDMWKFDPLALFAFSSFVGLRVLRGLQKSCKPQNGRE